MCNAEWAKLNFSDKHYRKLLKAVKVYFKLPKMKQSNLILHWETKKKLLFWPSNLKTIKLSMNFSITLWWLAFKLIRLTKHTITFAGRVWFLPEIGALFQLHIQIRYIHRYSQVSVDISNLSVHLEQSRNLWLLPVQAHAEVDWNFTGK